MAIQGEPVAHADLVNGSETTLHSHAGGSGSTVRYIQVRSASNVNITGTEATLDLVTIDLQTAGDFSVSSDQVTINNAGHYRVVVNVTVDDLDTSGGARCATEVRVQNNSSDIPGAYLHQYHRETTENSSSLEFIRNFSAGDVLRVRLLRLSGTTNLRTTAEGCRLLIQKID